MYLFLQNALFTRLYDDNLYLFAKFFKHVYNKNQNAYKVKNC